MCAFKFNVHAPSLNLTVLYPHQTRFKPPSASAPNRQQMITLQHRARSITLTVVSRGALSSSTSYRIHSRNATYLHSSDMLSLTSISAWRWYTPRAAERLAVASFSGGEQPKKRLALSLGAGA